jgi:hypothetical protein
MEPITALAQTVTTFLLPALPYLLSLGGKATEEASKKLGGDLWEGAKALWHKLSPKVEAKPDALDRAQKLAEAPDNERNKKMLTTHLEEIFEDDEALANEVRQILNKAQEAGVNIGSQGSRNINVGGDVSGGILNTGDSFNNKP